MNSDEQRVTTIRLPIRLAIEVDMIAQLAGKSFSDVVREALVRHVGFEQEQPTFRERLAERIEQDKKILNRLGGDDA